VTVPGCCHSDDTRFGSKAWRRGLLWRSDRWTANEGDRIGDQSDAFVRSWRRRRSFGCCSSIRRGTVVRTACCISFFDWLIKLVIAQSNVALHANRILKSHILRVRAQYLPFGPPHTQCALFHCFNQFAVGASHLLNQRLAARAAPSRLAKINPSSPLEPRSFGYDEDRLHGGFL